MPGTSTPLVLGDVSDFTTAAGVHYVIRAGTKARAYQLAATPQLMLEAPFSGTSTSRPRIAVDSARVLVGTDEGLFYASTATPQSSCGCQAPAVVLPAAPVPACSLNLCSPVSLPAGLLTGEVDGDQLFGVFDETQTSLRRLFRVDLKTGSHIAYGLQNVSPHVAFDATDVFVSDGNDLRRVNRATGAVGTVATGVYLPYYRGEGLLKADATHLYFYDPMRGLTRVAKTGGPLQVLMLPPQNLDADWPAIAIDATHVYLSANGRIWRVGKGGGAALGIAVGNDATGGLAANDTHLYFRTARGLERMKKGGGFRTLVLGNTALGADAHRLTSMHLEGRNLVAIAPPTTVGGAFTLVRIDLATGARTTVVSLNGGLQGSVAPAAFALSNGTSTVSRQKGCSCP